MEDVEEVSLVELEELEGEEEEVEPLGDGDKELLGQAEDQSSSDIFLEFEAEERT